MDNAEINKRFAFHKATEVTGPKHGEVRELVRMLAVELNMMLPEGREKAIVFTHLEDAMMWANAAIARNQDSG